MKLIRSLIKLNENPYYSRLFAVPLVVFILFIYCVLAVLIFTLNVYVAVILAKFMGWI